MNKICQTKKSIIILLLIILIFLLLAFFFYYSETTEKIQGLIAQNEQTSEKLKQCENENNELNNIINKKSLEIQDLNKKINNIESEKNELEQKISNLESQNLELNKKIEELNQEKENLNNNLKNISETLRNFEKELYEKINLIDNYKKEVNDAMSWYTKNSKFYKINDVKIDNLIYNLKESLQNKCIKISTRECTIKVGCIYLVNSEYQDFSYRRDETINAFDKILSLEDFLKNKGGDCEDYALFFKAEFNYLKELCKDKKLILETYDYDKEKLEKSDRYFLDVNNRWYMQYSKKVELNYTNLVVICGNMYDLNKDKISGHCMVALTKEKINSIDEIEFILNAEVIEPQTSEFQGIVGIDFKVAGFDYITNKDSYINSVITDDDFYIYSAKYDKWLSLKNLNSELENSEQKFLKMFVYLKRNY
ncbi:MAG: hypothetical protein QXS41_00645 [Candidatus Woesearchaeota archaeon]